MPEKGVYSSRIAPKMLVIHKVFLRFLAFRQKSPPFSGATQF